MPKDYTGFGPYTSRDLHPHVRYQTDRKTGDKAVEKPGYITHTSGSGKPEPYKAGKMELPARWKYVKWDSKRNPDNAGDGYFGWPGRNKGDPYIKFEYPGGRPDLKLEYNDRTSFRNARRPDKVAFQSKDAHKTSEFTSTFRTEQYRQALKGEQKHINAAQNKEILAALMDKMETQRAQRTFTEGLDEPEHLYDIGRTQETEFDPKAHRERFYINTLEKKMNRTKRYGNMRTTASSYGDFDLPKGGPQFGRMNVTKTFNDKGHLVVPGL